jgi:hypothetical protein
LAGRWGGRHEGRPGTSRARLDHGSRQRNASARRLPGAAGEAVSLGRCFSGLASITVKVLVFVGVNIAERFLRSGGEAGETPTIDLHGPGDRRRFR